MTTTRKQSTAKASPTKAPSVPANASAGHGTAETTAPATTAPKRFCGVKGKSGPGKGNSNAIRHGLKCGKLPKDARYIENRLLAFRRTLETAVMDSRGEVTLTDAAFIQTALRWERHAELAQRWLTKQQDELKPEQRLTFSREIARASAERDKAVAALHLDKDNTPAPWLLPAPVVTNEEANNEEQA